MRNIAIAAQFIAVGFTHYQLKIELPLLIIGLLLLQIIFFNIFVFLRLQRKEIVSHKEILVHLAIDIFSLALLLYFTGGATNPFVILFLFPLTISITILPARYSWLLAALAVSCYSLLMFHYQPLPINHNMHKHSEVTEYNLHLIGMWMAFILNACLITYYVYGMGNSLRQQQKQLSLAREQAIRDEQLVVLGTLAANTAHELGTPLATMNLLVDEINLTVSNTDNSIRADLKNLKKQIIRCKSSLNDLSASVGESTDLHSQKISSYLTALINEINERTYTTNISLKCNTKDTFILVDRSLTLSLNNIIENAIEASPDYVQINTFIINNAVIIEIIDHGPGLSFDAQQKVGQQPYSDKELGLGLGLYLAYAAIRRRHGSIEQTNTQPIGCLTTITLPLPLPA